MVADGVNCKFSDTASSTSPKESHALDVRTVNYAKVNQLHNCTLHSKIK